MSTTTTRLPLARAAGLAAEPIALLQPACARIEPAGSIRRRKPDVGDLELVAIPAFAQQTDLWGEPSGPAHNLLHHRTDELRERGIIFEDPDLPRWGPKYRRLLFREARCDLFIVTPESWGVQFLLRTGPAAFSKRLVTPRYKGGWLPLGLEVRDGLIWGRRGPLNTPTEESVFASLERPYIAPEERR